MHRRYAPTCPWLAGAATLLSAATLASLFGGPPWVTTLVVAAWAGVAMVAIMRRLDCDAWVVTLVLAGMALYVLYLGYTAPEQRNYDARGQHQYLLYIAAHAALPPPGYCNVCYHPPLYYVLAALWARCLLVTHWLPLPKGLPLLSLIFAWVFVLFGILTVRRLTRRRSVVYLATALLVFWPYSVINSIRVHNDSLASALMAAAIYFAVKWYQVGRGRDLWWATLFAALGLLTKGTALVVVAALVVVVALRWWRTRSARAWAPWALLAGAVLGVAFGLGPYRHSDRGDPSLCRTFFGDACLVDQSLFAGNRAANYFGFDVQTFLSEPYLASMRGTERNYFLPSLLKSSLFGTYNTDPERDLAYPLNNGLAKFLNALLLGMVALGLTALGLATRARLRRYTPVLAIGVTMVAGLAVFRLVIPSPHHNDLRHVFPLLILASLLYAEAVEEWRRRLPWVGMGARLVAVLFLVTSTLYFVPKAGVLCRSVAKATAERLLGGAYRCR